MGISSSSSGRERMDVPGIRRLLPLQLVVVISLFSDGRERIDVNANGTKRHMKQLRNVATQIYFNMS